MWFFAFLSFAESCRHTRHFYSLIKSASHSMFEFNMNVDTAQHPNFTTRLIVVITFFVYLLLSELSLKNYVHVFWCARSRSRLSLSLCVVLPFSFPLVVSHSLTRPLSSMFCVCCWFFSTSLRHIARKLPTAEAEAAIVAMAICMMYRLLLLYVYI